MTRPEQSEEAALSVVEEDPKMKGSKYTTLLRASSEGRPGKDPKVKHDSSRSLKSQTSRSAGLQKTKSEVWDKKKREKRAQKQKKKSGVLVKPTISPEDEALFQSRRRRRKKMHDNGVRFDFVEIREHAITIGDNPGGFKGPPLSIEWKYQNHVKMPLDEYEENRPFRRSGAQMNIPFRVREQMLLEAGHSRGEIREALRDVNIARRHRRRTIEVMKLSSLHEFKERLFRSSLNFTVKRGTKKKEREYLKKAMDVHHQMEGLGLDDTSKAKDMDDEKENEDLIDESSEVVHKVVDNGKERGDLVDESSGVETC